MCHRLVVLGIVLSVAATILGGCGLDREQPAEPAAGGSVGMPNPASTYCEEQGYVVEIRTGADGGQYGVCIFPDGSECDEWTFFRGGCGPGVAAPMVVPDPAAARDAALEYVGTHYGEYAAPPDLIWAEKNVENITAERADFQYAASSWVIAVSLPLTTSAGTVYDVVVNDDGAGFRWEGQVDATGQVAETFVSIPIPDTSSPTSGLPVVAWYGYVVSAPEGSQYDDYLVALPEGVVEVGLDSLDKTVRAEIAALRDRQSPGNHAHFWGVLVCDVPDYGGCQLEVARIRPDGPGSFFDPDVVEGWEGVIYSGPPGPRSGGDDYFALVGDYPIQYGITADAALEDTLALYTQLESLRDSGAVVRVWGQVAAGVMDWNGTQIQVNRIEVVASPSGAVPPAPVWPAAPDDDLVTYVNADFGYQLRLPPNATVSESGITGFPSDELPEGMSADEYMAQLQAQHSSRLCVQIQYGLGYINIAAPSELYPAYFICGRTGVGAGELLEKTEGVVVGGQIYTAHGFEFVSSAVGAGESLLDHDETMVVELADGTRIEYGSLPVAGATYQDYVTTVPSTPLTLPTN
jgi:putative hemolysin